MEVLLVVHVYCMLVVNLDLKIEEIVLIYFWAVWNNSQVSRYQSWWKFFEALNRMTTFSQVHINEKNNKCKPCGTYANDHKGWKTDLLFFRLLTYELSRTFVALRILGPKK